MCTPGITWLYIKVIILLLKATPNKAMYLKIYIYIAFTKSERMPEAVFFLADVKQVISQSSVLAVDVSFILVYFLFKVPFHSLNQQKMRSPNLCIKNLLLN